MESSSLNPILAVLIFVSCMSYINSSSAAVAAGKTQTEFIRISCAATTYPRLCFTSLSSHASVIQTSPKILAQTALAVSLRNTKYTAAMMLKLSQTPGLKPREVAAMHDCVEVVSDSLYQLRNSLVEMNQLKGSNFGLKMSDIQTWVSAALTDDSTCTDGFAGNAMNRNLKNIVSGRIVHISKLTSNALALINSYASFHGNN